MCNFQWQSHASWMMSLFYIGQNLGVFSLKINVAKKICRRFVRRAIHVQNVKAPTSIQGQTYRGARGAMAPPVAERCPI